MAAADAKLASLKDLFGTDDLSLEKDALRVGNRRYPILEDVIILLDPVQYTSDVRKRLALRAGAAANLKEFAEDVQFTFGSEWTEYDRILPEHEKEFEQYFDLVDLASLAGRRVCDLGCGIGRWSYFLKGRCRERVLVDFSDAIFTARRNLEDSDDCLFFMADLKRLPFREGFADFLFSLGVLHHLPTPCLEETRKLRRYAPRLLIFLYYALDNRPFYFRWILRAVTRVRVAVSKIRSRAFRKAFSIAGTFFVYLPLVFLGKSLQVLFGAGSAVPLYDAYHDKGFARIEQDVYDRFFTRIEQRVTRAEILTLTDTFRKVEVSTHLPYWHFTAEA